MQSSFLYLDILIFGIIAVFLILRLKNILGTKTDANNQDINNRETSKNFSNIVSFKEKKENGNLKEIEKILKVDPQFQVEDFLSGSKTFFKMVLESFANGNVDNIEPYLKTSVLKSFKIAINERIKEKETEIIELNSIKKNEIRSVSLTKTSIKISVFFETLQIRALMNKDSKVIDGDKDNEILVKDEWIFERKNNSDDPNWVLIETKSV